MSTKESSVAALKPRLSVMMLFQYAIWGAWLPLFFQYLNVHLEFSPDKIGVLFGVGACGALLGPFLAGQIADRWFSTEKFLAISHLIGAFLVWRLAELESYDEILLFSLFYSLVYAPTMPLSNALAFHHLTDRDKDFGRVRLFGTIGWILVGIGMGQWLLHRHTPEGATEAVQKAAQVAGMADAFKLSAILGGILGIYCLTLPNTPPKRGKQPFAPAAAFREIVQNRALLVIFLISFPLACVHQFYFVHTAGFLSSLKMQSPLIDGIFGVGGGGLMTIGQIAEVLVLALMPRLSRLFNRKSLLFFGLIAYMLRFWFFAFTPHPAFVIPALALHGFVFGCYFFMAFVIIDENTSPDVRASTQNLYNLVIIGFGTIIGNFFSGAVGEYATVTTDGAKSIDYRVLFSIPLWVVLFCFIAHRVFYPKRDTKLVVDDA